MAAELKENRHIIKPKKKVRIALDNNKVQTFRREQTVKAIIPVYSTGEVKQIGQEGRTSRLIRYEHYSKEAVAKIQAELGITKPN